MAQRSAACLVALSSLLRAAAAPHDTRTRFEAAISAADQTYATTTGDTKRSITLLDSLVADARSGGDSALVLLAVSARGRQLAGVGEAARAETDLRAALRLSSAARDTLLQCKALRWLGLAIATQSRIAESASYYTELLRLSLARKDRLYEGYGYFGLAYVDLCGGNTEAARRGYERAIAIFRELGRTRDELYVLVGMGRLLGEVGDLEAARRCFLTIVERGRQVGALQPQVEALNNLALLEQTIGDPGLALQHFREAYGLSRATSNTDDMIMARINITSALTQLGHFDAAVAVLDSALQVCRDQHYVEKEAWVLDYFADLRRQQGRPREAEGLYRAALALGGAVPPPVQETTVLGLVESMGDSVAALATLRQHAARLRPFLASGRADLFECEEGILLQRLRRHAQALRLLLAADRVARRTGAITDRLRPLVHAAECWRALGRPDSALIALRGAEQVWETQRGLPRDPQWRELRGTLARQFYGSMAELLLAYPPELPPQARTRRAFDALQKFKARSLLERMTGPGLAAGHVPLPEQLSIRTLAQVQDAVLGDGELLLDFFVSTDASFLFAVTRSECRAIRLVDGPALETAVALARDLWATAPPERAPAEQEPLRQAGVALARMLLGEVSDLVRASRRVIVAPDGPLNLVAFGALPAPRMGSSGSASATRSAALEVASPVSLLRDRELWSVPSATVLAQLRARPMGAAGDVHGHNAPAVPPAPDRIFACALGATAAGRALPGAVGEVRWLARRYRGVDLALDDFSRGGQALVEALPGHRVVHLATHTVVDDQRPWNSGLFLGSTRGGAVDAYLRASEIAELRLSADLCVLSGCESAGGRVLSGEGVQGLCGAFLSAGVPAVLATLWPVDDRSTARIVREFYCALGRGGSAAEALRRAQLTVATDPRTSHPFFWAGFVLTGDGMAHVRLARRVPPAAPACVAGAALVAIVALARARRRRRARRNARDRVLASAPLRRATLSDAGATEIRP
jgi:tetratricopeptide (TPR) repeat protein